MKVKPKEMVQYCIDAQYLNEVLSLNTIPKSIEIESITFRVGNPLKKKKRRIVPNRLSKFGLTSCRETMPGFEYMGRFDNLTRASMVKLAREMCVTIDEDFEKIIVERISLSFEKAIAAFVKTTKAINPDVNDQRKKLKILGLTSSEGNIANLIKELSAKKYSCKFERTFSDHVICSKLT